MVTEIHCNHIDAHAELYTCNTKYKYQITSHLSCRSSRAFPLSAGALVNRIVSHSRLGEPRPICTQNKLWVSEGVVSIVKPDLTTYRHKSLARFRQHCAPSERDKDTKEFCNLRQWITLFVIPKQKTKLRLSARSYCASPARPMGQGARHCLL